MKTSRILTFLQFFIVVYSLKEDISLIKSGNVTLGLKFKSIKCDFADPESVRIDFCYVKAISRNTSKINFGAELIRELRGPLVVKLLILYRFGTIFRQVIYREVNYCEVFRKGELISKNPLAHLIYNEYKSYIPEEAKIGCPLPPRYYNYSVPGLSASVPFSHMIASGLYKVQVNFTSRGKLVGAGFGTGEVTSPLKFWS